MAIGALLASISAVTIPGAVLAAPLERPASGDSSRPADARASELAKPAASRQDAAPRIDTSDKAKQGAASADTGFRLSDAEVISVRVRGQTELSGDYRVNPDMTIAMARLGRVAIGSMTVQELERYLGDRLNSTLRQDVSVAVEVVRFRPFFMTGQVTTPGSIEWRPNLTLIQAISLSGGVARPASALEADTPERRLLIEQARVRHSFAVAQLARVSAEKARKDSVEMEHILSAHVAKALPESREALEAFLARQNQLLEEQRAAHEGRIGGLARERDAVLHELEAARLQSDEVKLQVELTESQMEGIESLKSQQLLTNSRYLEHRRALAEIRVRYSESIQLVQRARSRYNSIEREIQIVQSEREALLNERIEGLEREIAELELTLGGPSGLLEAGDGSLAPTLTYHIARKNGNEVKTLVANLFTEIMPGDVVIVSSKPRVRSSVSNGLTPATNVPDALEETQRIMEGAITPGTPSTLASPSSAASARRAAAHRLGLPQQTYSRPRLDSGVTPPRVR